MHQLDDEGVDEDASSPATQFKPRTAGGGDCGGDGAAAHRLAHLDAASIVADFAVAMPCLTW